MVLAWVAWHFSKLIGIELDSAVALAMEGVARMTSAAKILPLFMSLLLG